MELVDGLEPPTADYKSAALPTELHQLCDCYIIIADEVLLVNTFFEKNLFFIEKSVFCAVSRLYMPRKIQAAERNITGFIALSIL